MLGLFARFSVVCLAVAVQVQLSDGEEASCHHVDHASMLQISSPRVERGEDPLVNSFMDVSSDALDAVIGTWILHEDGSFRSSKPLSKNEVFISNPYDGNVGCGSCDCTFLGRDGYASPCDIEINSRKAVAKWIPEHASVLEVGARHGSTSCAITARQKNSGRLVSMDADPDVWESLRKNSISHNCNFQIAKGLLGKVDGLVFQDHFGTFARAESQEGRKEQDGGKHGVAVQHYTLEDLESKHGLQFDAAVFDCEGCFAFVIKDFPELASKLKLLVIEVHNADEVAAVSWLQEQGWKLVDQLPASRQHILMRP